MFYFRTADFFEGADFLREARFGSLRASLTALPARNRTALLAAILIASPLCGFRPLRAGRAATSKVPRPETRTASPATREPRRLLRPPSPPAPPPLGLAQLPEQLFRSVPIGSFPTPNSHSAGIRSRPRLSRSRYLFAYTSLAHASSSALRTGWRGRHGSVLHFSVVTVILANRPGTHGQRSSAQRVGRLGFQLGHQAGCPRRKSNVSPVSSI